MAPRPIARPATRARQVKVVITGPFGAGKTTLIQTLSEIPVLSTERDVTEETERSLKADTTVAMDFGRLTIDPELLLYLFGTPGQRRFDFMWEILAEGMLGFVVLVDGAREESLAEAQPILEFFRSSADVPYIVAVNKLRGEHDVELARERLGLEPGVRCVGVDARDRESVKAAMVELLYAVLDELEAAEAAAV